MKIERFEDLEIWQDARELCKYVYKTTIKEPFCHDYKLRDQIRASSGSIMDNIAEGFERDGNKEFVQFLSVSKGSCGECRSQSYRCKTGTQGDQRQTSDQCSGLSSHCRSDGRCGCPYPYLRQNSSAGPAGKAQGFLFHPSSRYLLQAPQL